jgi:hypothetical protein
MGLRHHARVGEDKTLGIVVHFWARRIPGPPPYAKECKQTNIDEPADNDKEPKNAEYRQGYAGDTRQGPFSENKLV